LGNLMHKCPHHLPLMLSRMLECSLAAEIKGERKTDGAALRLETDMHPRI
jgi:hypothetical protein